MAGDANRIEADGFDVHDGRIVAPESASADAEIFDAEGRVVMPGLIDCHTHALFAGNRMDEHRMKLEGASYEEIARAGGGILSTVRAVRAATIEQLVEETLPRVTALAAEGVTTIEIKSGYGLTTEDELKMLRAIAALDEQTTVNIVPTFLGPHAVPPNLEREAYMEQVIDEMLPAIAAEKLAATADIYIESIAFDLIDFNRYADAVRDQGMKLRVHVDQLSNLGGTPAACAAGALSCDHLEYTTETDVKSMRSAGATAVLLPGAFYFLKEKQQPPVGSLRVHDVPIAVATDLNPGTSPLASLLTAMHLSTILFGLTPEEALLGVTQNAASALGIDDEVGTLEPGKRANFTVWDVPAPEYLLYQLGGIRPDAVFIEGQQQ